MIRAWKIRSELVINDRIAITRATFDNAFTRTKERIEFTFDGWDGKSYNGETRIAHIYRSNTPGYEGCRFIKVGKGVHYIDDDHMVINQQTGKAHPSVNWVVDVQKA